MTCNQAKYHTMHHRHPRYRGMHSKNFQNWARVNSLKEGFTYPPTNIEEEDDHYKIFLKAPGYDKVDFKISLSDNLLTVQVEREKSEEDSMTYREFIARNFRRVFELNEKIDADSIKAEYAEGILKIKLEKKEEFHSKVVEISVN